MWANGRQNYKPTSPNPRPSRVKTPEPRLRDGKSSKLPPKYSRQNSENREVVSKANANTPTVSSIAMDTSQDSDIDDVTDNLEYLARAEYDDFGMCSALNLEATMMTMTKTRRPPPYRESSRGGTGTFTNTARGAEAPSNVNDDAISTAIRTIRDDEAMATAIREFMRDIPTPEGAVMSNITLKTLPEKYNSILKH